MIDNTLPSVVLLVLELVRDLQDMVLLSLMPMYL